MWMRWPALALVMGSLGLFLWAGPAWAEGRPTGAAGQTPAATEPPAGLAIPPQYDPARYGWALMVGGGYQDFSNGDMRDRTNGGGAWDVRFIGGTRAYAGFEGAYVGAARSIQTLGASANNPTLVSNGLEGTLRLNAPIVKGATLLEPYGVVGLGWSRYHIANYSSNAAMLSDFDGSADDVMTVPLGLGFAYGYKAFIADVRATYTPTYYNDLLRAGNGSGTLNTWGVGGQVGWAF